MHALVCLEYQLSDVESLLIMMAQMTLRKAPAIPAHLHDITFVHLEDHAYSHPWPITAADGCLARA
jgi:hypothetical protein